MKLIESTNLSKMCDYSFGDQSSIINNIFDGFMKEANIDNKEFIQKYVSIKESGRNYMTLFIDNIRLYNRDIKFLKSSDKDYVHGLLKKNDLLELCSFFTDMNFIIFTGFEDTPIDEFIFDKIPNNVLTIYAANAICFGGKVVPIPYGLKRRMFQSDNKLDILLSSLSDNTEPNKLLYINHTISNNVSERGDIHKSFVDKSWATINMEQLDYVSYLKKLKEHKFMISPHGNAIDCDCHRNWELFYMKRVPIVKKCEYLECMFKDFPVLFVNDFSEVTEELLIANNHLYEEALKIKFNKLDLNILFKSYINASLNIKSHLKKNKEKYSPWVDNNEQGRIELKILPYLQEIENGFFIEAGALNGLFQSNTKILEDLGWGGLLVEPSKNAYEECLKNRTCFVENCALVSSDFKDEFVYGDFNDDGFEGMGARSSIQPTGVQVKAKTLTNLLQERNITHVDFISLDVEGYEIEALKGLDFNAINVSYMLIEVNSDFYSLDDLNIFLLDKGFINILNVSNFSPETTPGWPGNHQDYLFKNINLM